MTKNNQSRASKSVIFDCSFKYEKDYLDFINTMYDVTGIRLINKGDRYQKVTGIKNDLSGGDLKQLLSELSNTYGLWKLTQPIAPLADCTEIYGVYLQQKGYNRN